MFRYIEMYKFLGFNFLTFPFDYSIWKRFAKAVVD